MPEFARPKLTSEIDPADFHLIRQQDFETNLLQKSFNKFFDRNGLIFEKYGAALGEMRLAIHYYSYG